MDGRPDDLLLEILGEFAHVPRQMEFVVAGEVFPVPLGL